jgi:hypothetical protein
MERMGDGAQEEEEDSTFSHMANPTALKQRTHTQTLGVGITLCSNCLQTLSNRRESFITSSGLTDSTVRPLELSSILPLGL